MVDAAIIFIVIFLFIGIGIGLYFLMKSGNKCPDNCSDSSCSNNMCTTCSSGYGIDSSGTPDTDGSCPKDTSCPTGCKDTKCKNNVCKTCTSGSPNSDGTCPMNSYSLLLPSPGACRANVTDIYKPEDFDQSAKDGTNVFYTGLTPSACQDKCNSLASPKPCTAISYQPLDQTNSICFLFTGNQVVSSTTGYADGEVCYKKN